MLKQLKNQEQNLNIFYLKNEIEMIPLRSARCLDQV